MLINFLIDILIFLCHNLTMGDKFLKENVNTKYFELPCNKVKTKLLAFKYHLNSTKIPANNAELFICNKTSEYDKYFVNDSLEGFYVILKDEIIQKIYNKTITYDEQVELFANVSTLKNLMVSIVVFPEKNVSIFGDCQELPKEIIKFLLEFNMNIKFLYLIGTYFINPVWANENRVCDTKTELKFTIKTNEQKSFTLDEIQYKINKYMPSSASVYAKKSPIYIRSNKCAEDLEKILYICPKCNHFFTLKSEFNVIKCNNCGTAFEISRINAEINLTKTFTSLEQAKEFQFDFLSSQEFIENKKILNYTDINFYPTLEKKQIPVKCTFSIYSNKIEYEIENNSKTLSFYEILDANLSYNNTLIINAYDFDKQKDYSIAFQGLKKENLYILIDLLKIFEKKSLENKK